MAMSPDFPVLVIDGDPATLHLIECVLRAEGFAVTGAGTAAGAIAAFRAGAFPLVLLDPALPDGDGVALCRSIRGAEAGDAAVIVLISADQSLSTKVAAFGAGADDFLGKPIEMYELALRVKAIRRRLRGAPVVESPDLVLEPFRLLANARSVVTPQGVVRLTPVEFRLLTYFMQRPHAVIAAETLLREVWGFHPGTGSPELVRFHVNSLRKKLEADPHEPLYLMNTHGHGYHLRSSAGSQRRLG